MNNFVLSSCLLEKSKDDKKIITSILHRISDEETPYKVVIDKGGVLIDIYEKIANDNNVHVASWLRILSREPQQIEFINEKINTNQGDIFKFIETASNIRNEKKLFLYNHSIIPETLTYSENNVIEFNSKKIKVYNSNEAMSELSNSTGITINNENKQKMKKVKKEFKDTVVAKNGSTISGVEIKNNKSTKTLTKENLLIALVIGIIASLIAAWLWSNK